MHASQSMCCARGLAHPPVDLADLDGAVRHKVVQRKRQHLAQHKGGHMGRVG